jgi:hypothetical protein
MADSKLLTQQVLEYVKENLRGVQEMREQLTEKEAEILINKYGYKPVIEQLCKMNNYLPLAKKNRSVYLTCLKWFQMDRNNFYKPP